MTPDLQALLAQAQQVQQELARAQQELAQATVTGSAGGGMVTAEVTGTGELVDVAIQPEAVDPDDLETLAALVVAAVRDAAGHSQELQQQTLGPLAGGLSSLPGM